MTGEIDTFFAMTKEAFKLAFRAMTVARCFRNFGYYFVEKALYPEAVACYLLSMEYDPDAKQVQSELYYINQKASTVIPDPTMEDIQEYADKYGFPFKADEDIVGLSYAYGKHFYEAGNKDYAKYFLTIAYELTDMEPAERMLKELEQ